MDIKQEFYTPVEAAALLRCSRKTVYNYVRRGMLEEVSINSQKHLITRESIEQLTQKKGK